MIGINIEIQEIENGWVVKLFSDHGPSRFDKTVYCKDFSEVLEEVQAWKQLLEEDGADEG